jgi:hypothetical protein
VGVRYAGIGGTERDGRRGDVLAVGGVRG